MTTPEPAANPNLHEHNGRIFYGWPMVAVTTAVFIASAPGQTVVVSQFNAAFREEFNLSATALGAAYMIGTLAGAAPLLLVGKASDRFGPRLVTLIVATLFGLACAAMGLAQGITTLTVGFFLLRFLGQGSLGLLSGHAIALWFERRLGTVNGIKYTLTQLGFAASPAVALILIEMLDWRLAYAALGAIVWILVLPIVFFVAKDRPEQIGQALDGDPPQPKAKPEPTRTPDASEPYETAHGDELISDMEPDLEVVAHPERRDDTREPAFTLRQALRERSFWIVALIMSLNGLIGTALIFQIQPLLEARGEPIELGAGILRTWSLTLMVALFPVGWLADRLKPHTLLPTSLGLLAIASAMPILPGSFFILHASMIVFAVSQAISFNVGSVVIARYFGRAHHGAIRSCVTLLGVMGTGLGPIVLGVSFDLTATPGDLSDPPDVGTPVPGLIVFIVMCVPLLIAAARLRPPAAANPDA